MKYFYLIIIVCAFYTFSIAQETFTTSGTFTVPAGVTEITVEAWGGGGGGSSANTASGGGGGGYARSILTVTNGDEFNYTVGAGGTQGANGGNSVFNTTLIGGGGSAGTGSTGGVGGVGVGGNDANFNGGAGGNSGDGSNGNRGGGGGGGSATSTANGANGQINSGNTGGVGGNGEGNGGAGGNGNNGNGNDGATPGPGGGGGGQAGPGGSTSGSGANGQIVITYEVTGATCSTLTSVKSDVNDVSTNYIETPEQLNLYLDGADNYSFGVGANNDLLLEAFQVGSSPNTLNFAIDRLADRIVLRRAGNANQGPDDEERHILFFEQDAASYSGNDKNFNAVFFSTMEEALVGTGINRGADNVLDNTSNPNSNNIERLDYVFEDGIVVPSDPNTAGFPVFERGGNDNFNVGIISELDSNANPSEYNTIISYADTDWTGTGFNITTSVLSGFPNDGGDLTESATVGSQEISVIFVSFEDMGLIAGDIIYGYSLAGADSTTDCAEFLDFSNSNFFPRNTSSADGGIDLLSGGSFSKVAFIHTDEGWYQDDDPNDATPTCDDALVVSGGEAIITKDMTFNSISAIEGVLNLNDNTISLCGNITTESPFEVVSGSVRMVGPDKQFIRGRGTLRIDQLELDNPDGLDTDTEISNTGILTVTNGTLTVNENFTFRCGFDEQGGQSIKSRTAQIDEVLGSVVGNNNFVTEQCYPGRRAFRLVSPSATTLGTIRQNWQEDASAWNNDPAPGYGTHITGLGVQNVVEGTDDLQNGFDWQPSGNPSLFVLSNTHTGTWQPIGNTLTTLTAGTPYRLMIRGSRAVDLRTNQSPTSNTILRERGNIAVGDMDFTFSGLAENTPILIGNPYQANVNLQSLLANSTGVKTNEVAIWYPRLGGAGNVNTTSDPNLIGGRGGFITFNPSDVANTTVTYNGQAVGGIDGTSQVNNLLQPMQSVFLLADGTTNPVIRFRENEKEVNGDQLQVFSVDNHFKLSLLLFDESSFNQGETMKDGLVINFSENGQNELNGNDLSKFTNTDENLARHHASSSTLISVEDRYVPEANEELPLFINRYRTDNYVFVSVLKNLPENTIAYLKDSYTNEMHQLKEGEKSISFSIDASIPHSLVNNRFSLLFELETLGMTNVDTADISVYPNPVEEVLNISLGHRASSTTHVQIVDMLGRVVYTQSHSTDSSGNLQLTDLHLQSGAYILQLTQGDGEVYSHKLLKK